MIVLVADDNEDQVLIVSNWVLEAAKKLLATEDEVTVRGSTIVGSDGKPILQVLSSTNTDAVRSLMRDGSVDLALIDYRWPKADGGTAHVGRFCMEVFDAKASKTKGVVMSSATPISARISADAPVSNNPLKRLRFCSKDRISIAKCVGELLGSGGSGIGAPASRRSTFFGRAGRGLRALRFAGWT